MVPVSVMLHDLGIRILRYLDDWLVLALLQEGGPVGKGYSPKSLLPAGHSLQLRQMPFQPFSDCNVSGDDNRESLFEVFPSVERVSTLLSQIGEFLSYRWQNVVAWRSLLGCLSSLCLLVSGSCLRIRSLQLVLHDHWDFEDESVAVTWTL